MVLTYRWQCWLVALLLLFPDATQSAFAAAQQYVQADSLKIEGGHLKKCRVGYRTYGTLAADRSNVVLFPTWASASTVSVEDWIGPGLLVDSSKWYVIAIDAIGNSVSCSPSNSPTMPYMAFPSYSVRDMVRVQHQILSLNLGIDHLHAIVGLGMGGMQALQWAVTYPDYADRLVLLGTSPQPTEADHQRWDAQLRNMESGGRPLATALDSYRQLQAIRNFDLVGSGDMPTLAKKIKARMLIMTSARDTWVAPEPARKLAASARKTRYLLLEDLCTGQAPGCERREASAAVAKFLEQTP
jgi:homoserine O-acetyltransferase